MFLDLLFSHATVVQLRRGWLTIFNYFFYCSRVSDNLLAMSRPSTEIIEKYNIIDQFRRYPKLSFKVFQQPPDEERAAAEGMRIMKCSCLCLCMCVCVKEWY